MEVKNFKLVTSPEIKYDNITLNLASFLLNIDSSVDSVIAFTPSTHQCKAHYMCPNLAITKYNTCIPKIYTYIDKIKWYLNLPIKVDSDNYDFIITNSNGTTSSLITTRELIVNKHLLNLHELRSILHLTRNPSDVISINTIRKTIGVFPCSEDYYMYKQNDLDIETLDLLYELKVKTNDEDFNLEYKSSNILKNFIPKNIISLQVDKSWIKLNKSFKFYSFKNTSYLLPYYTFCKEIKKEIIKLKLLYKYGGYLVSNKIKCLIPIENWGFLKGVEVKDLIFIIDKFDVEKTIIISTARNFKIKKLIELINSFKEPNIQFDTFLLEDLSVYFEDLSLIDINNIKDK